MSARGADFGFAKNGNEPFYSDKGFSEPCPPQKSLARCYSGSGHFDLFFSTNFQYIPLLKKPMLPLKKFGKFGEFEVFCQILDNEDFFIPKKV